MRLVDLLHIAGPALLIVLAPILIIRRRLVRSFQRTGATSPESAITPSLGNPIGRWWLKRLARDGVLRMTPGGTQWLEPGAWTAYRAIRRRRAVTVLILTLLSVMLIAVMNRGT